MTNEETARRPQGAEGAPAESSAEASLAGARPAAPVAAGEPAAAETAAPVDSADPPGPQPVETAHEPVEVRLEQSVRYGRIIGVGIALGAVILAVAALFFPVPEDADYELGQAVGLMAVLGAAIGLALGAVLSLVLGLVAKRRKGAALAVLTDVR